MFSITCVLMKTFNNSTLTSSHFAKNCFDVVFLLSSFFLFHCLYLCYKLNIFLGGVVVRGMSCFQIKYFSKIFLPFVFTQ